MDRLIGPKLKIERANKHITELTPIVEWFFKEHPHTTLSHLNPIKGDLHVKVKGTDEPPPTELSVISGEVLYLLRSALDHLVTEVATKRGVVVLKKTGFPIEATREKFETVLQNRKIEQRLPDLASVLRKLKPYERGNDLLWWLHWLNGREKHQTLMAIAGGKMLGKLEFTSVSETPPTKPVRIVDKWFRYSEENVVAVIPRGYGDIHGQVHLTGQVSFSEIKALEFQPIQATLKQFCDLTAGIVRIFEARFFT